MSSTTATGEAPPRSGVSGAARAPGLKDVAARCGVSIKTVSRVINAEQAVHHETRQRVLAAIQDLGYVPNTAARSLKSGTGGSIGVVVDSLVDPFFAALVHAIETRALAEGLSVLVATTGLSRERERDHLLGLLAGHQAAGVILAPASEDYDYLDAFRASRPVVIIDRARPGFHSVVVDDREGTRGGMRQLVELGHRRIAFYAVDDRFLTNERRFAGYRDVLAEAGIPLDPDLVASRVDGEIDHAREVERLFTLADPPTAFCISDARTTIGLVGVLHSTGREQTAMVSFGDFPLADVLRPAVTCIDQDAALIGNAAMERLLALRANPGADPQEWVVPTSLIHRGSGEIAAPATPTRGGRR